MSEKCLKGINWGKVELNENKISMNTDGKNLLNVDLKKLQNSTINKNDIILELTTDDLNQDDICLCEMRLYIPPVQSQNEQPNKDQDSGDEQSNQQIQGYAQTLHKDILNKADIGKFSGESIATIRDIQLIVPRGKYTLDMYKSNVKFHGHSYNYIVEYKNINRAFLLPLPDEIHFGFVLGLDTPVKQGSTVYPYIVMNLKKEEVMEPIEVKLKPEEYKELDIEDKYEGEFFSIVATLFKKLVKVNIYVPGKYKSSDGQQSCVKCTVKTNPGYLFPLQTSIIFINKPVIYISIKEIQSIEFHRIGSGAKMFDIKIITKNQSFTFQGLEKAEQDDLMKYFQEKKVPIKKIQDDAFLGHQDAEDNDYSESDSRSKQSGKNKKQKEDNDDEDEDDDSDFEAAVDAEDDDDDDMDEEIPGSEIEDQNKEDSPPKKKRTQKTEIKKEQIKQDNE